jgi:hypothetical protein
MQRLKALGLGLVAVLAMSAIVAAAAQAEPEFVPEKGTFPVKFSSPLTTNTTFLQTKAHGQIKCTSLESSGELTAARAAGKIEVKFKGCKAEKFGAGECNTAGKAKGEIVTEKLKAKPVFFEGKVNAKEERGLDVTPEVAGQFAAFECTSILGTEKLKVENGTAAKNSVIGRVAATEVGVFLNKVTITFKQTGGVQEPKVYEEPAGTLHEDFLETEGAGPEPFGKESSGESAVETITYAGAEKVKLT